jgi:hypothetical protein
VKQSVTLGFIKIGKIIYAPVLRNENSIKPKTKPDRFLKPVRFGLKVSEIIKAPFLN